MHVLILGAGFGGLELSTILSETLGEQISVTLIDRADGFVFGYSKLDVMFGRVQPDAIRLPYRELAKPGVRFLQETILSIDPDRKRVRTDRGEHEGDILVVALGADLDPAATPGLDEFGNEFYSVNGAVRLRDVLPTFTGGTAVIAVTTPHFKCPPAPSEAAFLLNDFLKQRGLRDSSRIIVAMPWDTPLPVSSVVAGEILDEYAACGIEFMGKSIIRSIGDGGRSIEFADGTSIDTDLILAVPVHVAPPVVLESGMTEGGWIPVDKTTLTTRFPDVYSVGDVASVGVPRAGVFSEGQARVVADQIIARFRAETSDARYEGVGACYIEFGSGTVGRVDVNFLGGPTPTAQLQEPTTDLRAEKANFGSSRRARWFGL